MTALSVLFGNLYLPWHLAAPARLIPYQFSAAYLLGAGLLWACDRARSR